MKVSAKDVSGILLSERKLMNILNSQFKEKIIRIETELDSYRVCFDPSEPINAVIMGREDMIEFMRKYYGRTVIDVADFSHEQYLVRFEE
ncbi:MAG: hypothetical protein ABH851_07670 [Methanobacteriota archaeon]